MPSLRAGDLVAVVAPAGAADPEALARGLARLQEWGLRVRTGRSLAKRYRYLAGDDAARLADLQEALSDPAVRAVFAARGGFGTVRLLGGLDFGPFHRAPKPVVGYSDVSLLLNYLVCHAGTVAIHGPMVASDLGRDVDAVGAGHLWALLQAASTGQALTIGEMLCPGLSEGVLVGGCLSVIASAIGTPFEVPLAGRVVLFEDAGEEAYAVERLLLQLRLAGRLEDVRGLLFGHFRGAEPGTFLRAAIAAVVADLGVPVGLGLPVGHGVPNLALPLGARVRIDGPNRRLEVLSDGVRHRG